jgi:biopolymer transport protein TolR
MGMGGGSTGGLNSDINVTPMIDILLVLLITFMAITPVAPKGLNALVPQPPKTSTPPPDNDDTVVVEIRNRPGTTPAYLINNNDFNHDALEPKLAEVFATRANKVFFIKGDPMIDYGYVADVIDMGHQAGVDNIGLITPKIEAGQ